MKEFKVIEIKIEQYDGRMYYNSYEYVSSISSDSYGNIVVNTCGNILDAMRFNNMDKIDEHETKVRNKFLEFVKSYFPKQFHTISYHTVNVNY